jgi:hypothetical protein
MQTLKDAIKARSLAVEQLQVYKELKVFLEQFLSRDGVPTINAIQITNTRDIVQESTIEDIGLELDRFINDLEQKIKNLDDLKVK